jgi:polyhydroxybutyrate depolymerase
MKSILFLFLFITAKCFAQQDIDKTILVDNRDRQYLIHLPPSFESSQKLPVIFALHGGGGTYKNTIKFYNLDGLADQNGFIIVYPNAVNKAWHMPGIASREKKLDTAVDDVHFISVLIDTLIANYKANDKRVFCTGISRGGMFSLFLADKLCNRIAGIAPVCGGISKTVENDYSFSRPMPVLLINGTDDPLVKYNGGVGKFNKRNEDNEDADMLPTEDLLAKIIKLDNCSSNAVAIQLPDTNTQDDCTAVETIYNCNKVTVDFIKVINGGHTWPGGSQYLPKFLIGKVCRDFNASEKIFDFFKHIAQ